MQTETTIADRLHLSQKTVRNHVSIVLAKLNAATRAQAWAAGLQPLVLRPGRGAVNCSVDG